MMPHCSLAVSASRDGTLKVWKTPNGRLDRMLEGHTHGVVSVAVTPDGQRAISASSDRTLKVWDLASGRLERTLEGHTAWVQSVAVTPDGRRAVSASSDRTLKVWNLASGRGVASFVSDWPMTSCAVAPEGRTIVGGDARGRVHFLRLMEPEDAAKEAESMTEHVFLSYCRDSDTAVRQLYDELTAAGHAVWRDQESVLPGMDWKHEIRRAIRGAYAVVICFSQEIAARHRSGIYPEALLAIKEYCLMPPGSI
jgi:hypothetical protein